MIYVIDCFNISSVDLPRLRDFRETICPFETLRVVLVHLISYQGVDITFFRDGFSSISQISFLLKHQGCPFTYEDTETSGRGGQSI